MARKKSTGIEAEDGSDIEQFGTIFDHHGVKLPETTPEKVPETPGQDISALLAKIEALSGTVNALASRPAPAPQYIAPAPVAPSAPKWDWADPVTEPEAFGATLAQYTTHVIDQYSSAQRAEQEKLAAKQRHTNALWNDFSSTYKDYAEKPDQIGYAYQRVTSRLAENGVNLDEYAQYRRNDLFQAVAKEYDAIFGAPNKPNKEAEPDDSDRTSGIFGGFESGGQPNKAKEKGGDLISDLKDMQRASGFF